MSHPAGPVPRRQRLSFQCAVTGEQVSLLVSAENAHRYQEALESGELPCVIDLPDGKGCRVQMMRPEQVRAERAARKRWARDAAAEQEAADLLLGPDCPPLQRRLFEALADGISFRAVGKKGNRRIKSEPARSFFKNLSRAEVVQIVYADEKGVDHPERFFGRLRTLQNALNGRLLGHKAPYGVVCPLQGKLALRDNSGKIPSDDEIAPLPRWLQMEVDEAPDLGTAMLLLCEHDPALQTQKSETIGVADCVKIIRRALAKGEQSLEDLQSMGRCSAKTVQRALKQIGIKPYRKRFGGKLYARLSE